MRMGGWVDGWMGGWVDGWMGGCVDGYLVSGVRGARPSHPTANKPCALGWSRAQGRHAGRATSAEPRRTLLPVSLSASSLLGPHGKPAALGVGASGGPQNWQRSRSIRTRILLPPWGPPNPSTHQGQQAPPPTSRLTRATLRPFSSAIFLIAESCCRSSPARPTGAYRQRFGDDRRVLR